MLHIFFAEQLHQLKINLQPVAGVIENILMVLPYIGHIGHHIAISSELATACNQYRRTVLMKGQPTSQTPDEAMANIKEELVDAIICIKELIMILGIEY